ncbi:hypothetical protein A2348_00460 [Candidatus Uhrbacteria bacterium RIFOXYB12_FULL_58_10]|uniref:Glycosyltransferase RgtA/B/C/D-like domain-containing protein n=1 Tax=Candidatus Uhrbacteria bacterium RIFOXYB2_FULL_57_15 TaxID=1802422 RepID=A0A1F7W6F0_9BACT|nr:MAG: hypothetical protein A2348_00460 [Candidatus Uhrbacteria bacterium RIFOXYB12_FULL_58_10]OGL98381.1 MAG: hypothetical protein A2304_01650 [Candidatus Uhrbacteria bacterium RIFOXYB2_FULL_57_15]OGM00164.1 MAG: hypothetical protein A2501_01305 [Candidatus Uhrbacteria bacterium RIFOXYC12_FULL_57_11]
MFGYFARFYLSIFVAGFLALAFSNAFAWQQPIIGVVLLAAFVGTFGSWIGRWAAPSERGVIRIWVGAWFLLSGIMLAGTAAYYAFAFTQPVALVLMGATGPIAWWLLTRAASERQTRSHDLLLETRHAIPARVWISGTAVVASLSCVMWILARAATTNAARTVWESVPSAAFFAFGLSTLVLTALLFRGRERALTIPLSIVSLFALLAVAIIVFPLGFGFDPFIHQATEEHIATFGSITPKPFYYVGQYVLVLFAHHGFALPVGTVNAILVPLLAALSIPLAWYAAATHLLRDRAVAAATLAGVFLLPLSAFILTTPQGLANLWTLLLVLGAVPALVRDERPRVWPLALPALATLTVHPIAGLPAILFVILLASDPSRSEKRLLSRLVFWTAAAVGCVILPLSFVANSLLSTGTLGLNLSNLSNADALSNLSLFFSNRFDPLLDFVYLYGFNAVVFFVLFACFGWLVSRKHISGALRIPLIMAAMLAVNWALLSTAVDFSFLIDYERQNFAARLVPLALYFLSPFVILALGAWIGRVRPGPASLRVATVVLLAALGTASLYLTYPRDDAYETGHGYNVSQTDINAVHEIESNASGASYVTLANQTVSAAAVRELGFIRYFGDQFFYPIPTGGDLYDLFLRMNGRPSREIALGAIDLVNARCAADTTCTQQPATRLYYVVNDYWWEAPRIVETAKQTADSWWALDGGAVHVFRYEKLNPQ